jgi:hypothetical protein
VIVCGSRLYGCWRPVPVIQGANAAPQPCECFLGAEPMYVPRADREMSGVRPLGTR